MSYQIEVIDNPLEFSAAVAEVSNEGRNELILGKWSGGLLEFAGIAFPGVENNDVYAKLHERKPNGRDPHFDVYKEFVDPKMPWAGHFNLSGEATLETVVLPADLSAVYETRYPVQTAESAEARRHLSRFALEEPGANVGTAMIAPMSRFVLPVRPKGPHIVHNIVPTNPENPGSFVKLITPPNIKAERDDLLTIDYIPLDMFLTQSLGAQIQGQKSTPSRLPSSLRKITRGRRLPQPDGLIDQTPPRRRCQGID